MHELNVTEKLAENIIEICKVKKIGKPKIVNLDLGELTTYKKDQIEYYFNIIQKEYLLLKEVKLNIKEIPGKIFCHACQKESRIIDLTEILCKHCQSNQIEIIQGKDFNIASLEY